MQHKLLEIECLFNVIMIFHDAINTHNLNIFLIGIHKISPSLQRALLYKKTAVWLWYHSTEFCYCLCRKQQIFLFLVKWITCQYCFPLVQQCLQFMFLNFLIIHLKWVNLLLAIFFKLDPQPRPKKNVFLPNLREGVGWLLTVIYDLDNCRNIRK